MAQYVKNVLLGNSTEAKCTNENETLLRFTYNKWCFGAVFSQDGFLIAAAPAYYRICNAQTLNEAKSWCNRYTRWKVVPIAAKCSKTER